MTNQTSPPRTRDERVIDLIKAIHQFGPNVGREIRAALDAERAEALAELRTGAEPVAWEVVQRGVDEAFITKNVHATRGAFITKLTPLYTHPTVAREAELAAEVERLRKALEELTSASEEEYCSDATEKGPSRCADDESVAWGHDGEEIAVKFGHIRQARAALDSLSEKN